MTEQTEDIFDDQEICGGTAADADEFLGFEPGTFDHIPHYARYEALDALLSVREMEKKHIFRPGLYYIVLSDLCRATEASLVLGNDISRKRVQTFILTCVDALGHIDTTNYHLFLREIGDAVLMLFSSFKDAYEWWLTMHSWLNGRDNMWRDELDLSRSEQKQFRLAAKTIIHAGEVSYSGKNIPLSAATNQVFKVEKNFKENELGITEYTLLCARPVLRDLKLRSILRASVKLPGDKDPLGVYLINNYGKILKARERHARKIYERNLSQQKHSADAKKPRS
jgi:hypothetical protein